MLSTSRVGEDGMEIIGWAALGYLGTNLLALLAIGGVVAIGVRSAPRFRSARVGRDNAVGPEHDDGR
ncbi:hypothetical protein [Mycetocola reblochoni]|uniref:Uncharacterized protein n=3 Tax=Mycetocola reblochoni TaxID=331618 RepID=A0A1R4JW72_9MICO|nr:hypothetical protein [Mycetocola reblochoni]RLP68257.1 hypothetical protein D9V30_11160 [Mycetocola reblochoni]SJN36075.1 hypothetical protein FM119_09740 [Mycetocola reblochoni REB411]